MESSNLDLKNLFTRFAKIGNAASDGSILSLMQVEKWFASANIIGDTLTINDLSKKMQTQFKPPGVSFKDFLIFLEDLAPTLNTSIDELTTRLSSVPDPTTVSSADTRVADPVTNVDSAGNMRHTFSATDTTRPPTNVDITATSIGREVVRDPPHIDEDVPFRATYTDLPTLKTSPTSLLARDPTAASRVGKAGKDDYPLPPPAPTFQNIPEQVGAPTNITSPEVTSLPSSVTPAKKTGKFKKKT